MAAPYKMESSSKHEKDHVHRKRDDKKPVESTKYYVISTESIVTTGESVGISELGSDVSKSLSEDVSYRLREVIFNCSVLLRHSKSKKLTTDIVDSVFNTCGIPPVYGHSAIEPLTFNNTVLPNLSVIDDVEIDLPTFATSVEQYIQLPDISLHGEWVHPDSSSSDSSSTNLSSTKKDEPTSSGEKASAQPAVKKEDALTTNSDKLVANSTHIPSFLVTYFRHFAKVILSESDKLLQVVLDDLRRNMKLGLIVPCFLNLVAFSLQKLPRGMPICLRLLSVVEAITCNKHIHPEGSISVSRLISVLLLCAVEVRSPNLDDYAFRSKAGHMLAKVVNAWCRSETKLYLDILQKLSTVLINNTSSLKSHYGALVTLYALGPDALDQCLWPHLNTYLAILEPQVKVATTETIQVERALLMAAELLYYQEWRWHGDANKSVNQLCLMLHQLLYDHYGDILCIAKAYGLPHKATEESCVATRSADIPVFSLAKHPVTNVFELDYMNWTAIAPMPSNLATLLRTSSGSTFVASKKRKQSLAKQLTMDTAFDLPPQKKRVQEVIKFSFAGSNPVPLGGLHRRVVDPMQVQFVHHSAYHERSCRLRCIGKLVNKTRSHIASARVPHILTMI